MWFHWSSKKQLQKVVSESSDSFFTSPKESEHSLSSRLSLASWNNWLQSPAFHASLKSSVVCSGIRLPNSSTVMLILTPRNWSLHMKISVSSLLLKWWNKDCSYPEFRAKVSSIWVGYPANMISGLPRRMPSMTNQHVRP